MVGALPRRGGALPKPGRRSLLYMYICTVTVSKRYTGIIWVGVAELTLAATGERCMWDNPDVASGTGLKR